MAVVDKPNSVARARTVTLRMPLRSAMRTAAATTTLRSSSPYRRGSRVFTLQLPKLFQATSTSSGSKRRVVPCFELGDRHVDQRSHHGPAVLDGEQLPLLAGVGSSQLGDEGRGDAYVLGAGPNLRLPVIPSPRQEGHGAVRVQHAGSIKTATTPRSRGSDNAEIRGSDN
jgi:hypothetical protein